MSHDNGNTYIDHTSTVAGTGAVILKEPALRSDSQRDASWEFLKWWTSADTQLNYSNNIESILIKSNLILLSLAYSLNSFTSYSTYGHSLA